MVVRLGRIKVIIKETPNIIQTDLFIILFSINK
jgi:hypothetical protein